MRTYGNEFFYNVTGLMVPKDEVRDSLLDYIELFIDQMPILEEQIKKYLASVQTVGFIMSMKTISGLLNEIYANWLVAEADKIIRHAESGNIEKCKKKIEPFISDLLTLSIDLQIAQKNSGMLGKQSLIENYINIINNLNAINTLINNSEYDKVVYILAGIGMLKHNKKAKRLMELVMVKDKKAALNVADVLHVEYTGFLRGLGVSMEDSSFKHCILAVDDHSNILNTIRGMLEPYFKVYAAAGGKTALAIMEKHKPDLFLLDIKMPQISGFELAKTIRANREHKTTPIIFLTSSATRECVVEALQCGADDFIVKPASFNSLMLKISKLLDLNMGIPENSENN